MDLISYDQNKFNEIRREYLAKTKHLNFSEVNFVPISALSETDQHCQIGKKHHMV